MTNERTDRCGMWLVALAVISFALPVLYILGSGPALKCAEFFPNSIATVKKLYSPVISIPPDTVFAKRFDWYWGCWNTGSWVLEVGLTKWMASPKAHSISRSLGVD